MSLNRLNFLSNNILYVFQTYDRECSNYWHNQPYACTDHELLNASYIGDIDAIANILSKKKKSEINRFVNGQHLQQKVLVRGVLRPCTTPLQIAIKEDHDDIVKLLLLHGADPNLYWSDVMLIKPLHLACCKTESRIDTITHLLDHGAEIDALNHVSLYVECVALDWLLASSAGLSNHHNTRPGLFLWLPLVCRALFVFFVLIFRIIWHHWI